MGFFENIRLSFSALAANKMRSLLTMLGIIIGISAVITITTIGNSIQQTLEKTFNQFGMNFFYTYLQGKYYENEDDDEEDFSFSLEDEDMIDINMLNRLMEKYPDEFSPVLENSLRDGTIINKQNDYIKVSVMGITSGVIDSGKIKILKGRNISMRDSNECKHSILVSDIFVRQYFNNENENPLDKTISITLDTGESYEFTIIGVYEYSESKLGKFPAGIREKDKQTTVFVPFGTAEKIQGNIIQGNIEYRSTFVQIMCNDDFNMADAAVHLQEFFDEEYKHNKHWGVYIENAQEQMKMMNTVINVVTIAISVIAAISLLVGGVGVMNIMLVSITERTKEIGIRKALGAQNSSIRLQFVIEAIIICLIGGIIGILTGIINGVIIGKVVTYIISTSYAEYMEIIKISIRPSLSAIMISVLFSTLTGIFFGYYPANKAAKMKPIDALRYE